MFFWDFFCVSALVFNKSGRSSTPQIDQWKNVDLGYRWIKHRNYKRFIVISHMWRERPSLRKTSGLSLKFTPFFGAKYERNSTPLWKKKKQLNWVKWVPMLIEPNKLNIVLLRLTSSSFHTCSVLTRARDFFGIDYSSSAHIWTFVID